MTVGRMRIAVRVYSLPDVPLGHLVSITGQPTDAIQIESISVSPDPPQPGKDLSVTVKAKAIERIEVRTYGDRINVDKQ